MNAVVGRPAGARPATAFFATHYNVDFSEPYLASLLAERGFGFLGWNTRFRGNEAHFLLDHALAEIGVGVRWLREQAGVERVVLLGNSGGGSLMAAYQSQAVEPNVTPVAGMRPLPAVEELPPELPSSTIRATPACSRSQRTPTPISASAWSSRKCASLPRNRVFQPRKPKPRSAIRLAR